MRRVSAGLACLWAFAAAAWAAEPPALKLPWNALESRIAHKQISFVLPDGTQVQGRVIAVEKDGLRMKVTKSSNKRSRPKGKQLVPRRDLTLLQVTDYRWAGRLLGTLGAMGLATGIVLAQQIDLYEGPMVIVVPAVSAAGVIGSGIGGYYVGKRIDRRVTQLVILPDDRND